jgi:hypothetical protein
MALRDAREAAGNAEEDMEIEIDDEVEIISQQTSKDKRKGKEKAIAGTDDVEMDTDDEPQIVSELTAKDKGKGKAMADEDDDE